MSSKKSSAPEQSQKTAEKRKILSARNPVFMLLIALAVCFVSALGAYLIKNGGGSITVKDLNWETPSGHTQAAQLFIPKTATEENPAPAIVTVHGWTDNSEMQDPFYVEYARRGYVVLAIDMYSHGNSEALAVDTWWNEESAANGAYDGVKLLASLPYVDTAQIGIAGHSNGAWASNMAVLLDNEAPEQLISAVLLVNNDAMYTETPYYSRYIEAADTAYTNIYGGRDVGMVASQHEFLFHRILQEDGSLTSPLNFMEQPVAQSFLNFGKDPAGLETRNSYTLYTENIDGKDTIRVIYNPDLVHTQGFFSAKATYAAVEFFQAAFAAPTPIDPGNQIWQWKTVFNTLGVIGFFMFFVYFILVMLKTKFFGVLKARVPVTARETDRQGKVRMWRGLIGGGIFSAISYPIVFIAALLLRPAFFTQERPWALALWSLVCGLFTLLVIRRNYRKYAKPQGLDLREHGAVLSKGKLGRSILLGLLTAAAAYGLVFITDYLFKVEFRIWILFNFRTFDADKLFAALKILPFMALFYILNSIATNVFNYIRIGKKEWVNTLIVTVLNPLGPILFFAVVYGYFYATGLMPFDYLAWGVSTMGGWIVSVVAVLAVSAITSRIIYKATRNPYIHGVAFSVIISIMMCSTALTAI